MIVQDMGHFREDLELMLPLTFDLPFKPEISVLVINCSPEECLCQFCYRVASLSETDRQL